MTRQIEIDPNSGLCFGVSKAIEVAENELKNKGSLYCLGEIVHNEPEVNRLNEKGLSAVSHQQLQSLNQATILFRAHGEPPQSYIKAKQQNLTVIDATCPVVLKLQQRFRKAYSELSTMDGQLLLFGKKGHAEVVGLMGQVNDDAIVIETDLDLKQVDFNRPIELFSQTTKDVADFKLLVGLIASKMSNPNMFKYHDTICRQVSNRIPLIIEFAKKYEIIIFVGGSKSSNAKVLFHACQSVNSRSYFVSDTSDINPLWFEGVHTVGISGATSTPHWQLQNAFETIKLMS